MLKRAMGLMLIMLAGVEAQAQDSFQTAVIPGASGRLFAIAPDSGVVAFGSATKSVVTMCPKLASDGVIDQSVSTQLGAVPSQLIYKEIGSKGFFFALCQSSNTVYQLDAASLKIVNQLTLKNSAFSIAAASDSKNPYVYYGTGTGIGRVDWTKLRDQGELPMDLGGTKTVGRTSRLRATVNASSPSPISSAAGAAAYLFFL